MNISRTKKIFYNMFVGLITYAFTLCLTFFSRKFFLNNLGADFLGLTSTFYNILSLMNLAELGIGSAICYNLYKPLAEDDCATVNEIVSVIGWLYRWVGSSLLIISCLMLFFLPWMFAKSSLSLTLIFFCFICSVAGNLFGYFLNFKQVILEADQRMYLVIGYYQGCNFLKVIIQMFLLLWTKNYYIWIIVELLFSIVNSVILNITIKRKYPLVRATIKNGKRFLRKYSIILTHIKQIFLKRLSIVVLLQIDQLLVYLFFSLSMVTYYANYQIIFDKLLQFFGSLVAGTYSSVGNMVAKESSTKVLRVFYELLSSYIFIGGILSISFYHLLPSFITVWLGKEYVLSQRILGLMAFYLFVRITVLCVNAFLNGYGLFYDVWASWTMVFIKLAVSLVAGYYWGIEGILLGSISAVVCIEALWRPYFLFKCGFKNKQLKYWLHSFVEYGMLLFAFGFSLFVIRKTGLHSENGWCSWIAYSILWVCLLSVSSGILFFLVSHGFRDAVDRVKNIILSKMSLRSN